MVPSQRRYNSFECSSIEHRLVDDHDDDDSNDGNDDDDDDNIRADWWYYRPSWYVEQ